MVIFQWLIDFSCKHVVEILTFLFLTSLDFILQKLASLILWAVFSERGKSAEKRYKSKIEGITGDLFCLFMCLGSPWERRYDCLFLYVQICKLGNQQSPDSPREWKLLLPQKWQNINCNAAIHLFSKYWIFHNLTNQFSGK